LPYDALLIEAAQQGIHIYEKKMPTRIKGLYADNIVCLNNSIPTRTEKGCVLAEEIGHYHTSSGNILDQSDVRNRKQELRARRWAYTKLVPLSSIVQAHKLGIRNKYEFADFLNVTEDFLSKAIEFYIDKFGLIVEVNGHHICLEPLGVYELFDL